MKRAKVCLVTHSLLTVKFFLVPHIVALAKKYDVTLVANVHDKEFLKRMNLPIRVIHMPIERKISLIKDLESLFLLTRFFLNENFDVVHTVAPKAGLVGILAAWLARVPKRLHVFQGEVWATKKGIMRIVLKNTDRLMATLSTHLLVVSRSEREFLIEQKIISADKSTVLGSGSICGVDMNKFKPDQQAREVIRKQLGIKETDIIILFLGRLNSDKGIIELINAFNQLDQELSARSHLVIVGPDEEDILKTCNIRSDFKERTHFMPYTEVPEQFMAASDILVLPSHREGFGLVIIEAAATKVPAIGSRIYGITDAIQDGQTGFLFDLADIADLTKKLQILIKDESLRKQMGEAAYVRCRQSFVQQSVVEATLKYYENNLIVI